MVGTCGVVDRCDRMTISASARTRRGHQRGQFGLGCAGQWPAGASSGIDTLARSSFHLTNPPGWKSRALSRGNGCLRRTPVHTPVGDATSRHAAVSDGTTAVTPEFTTTPCGTWRHHPAGLENRSGVRATGGSNPSPSATNPLVTTSRRVLLAFPRSSSAWGWLERC